MRFMYAVLFIIADITAKILGALYAVSALIALGASLYGIEVMLDALPAFGAALAPAWGPLAVMPMLGAGIGAALTVPILAGSFVLAMKAFSNGADAARTWVCARLTRAEAHAAPAAAPAPAPEPERRVNRKVQVTQSVDEGSAAVTL